MGRNSKQQYLWAIWDRYQRAGRRYKSKILDEFCAVCGYTRKYAIGLLRRKPGCRRKKPGPPRRYDARVFEPLKARWLASEQLCSKRLKAALPLWLPFYEQEHGALEEPVRQKLLQISAATIDRLLKKERARYRGKGLCGTRPGGRLQHQIPIRTGNDDVNRPGFLEADTVAHCGNSLAGDFIWSLTFTDIYSQWTENRAVWNKGAQGVLQQVKELEAGLPFELLGFDVDNGSEFLTFHLWRYLLDRPRPVPMTRSRPYRKNDQAHVEQKNWTHVRQLLGYQRLEQPESVPLINELYRTWGLLHNFFHPNLKLLSKTRKGSKTLRQYGPPQTPYQRLIQSEHLSPEQKQKLQSQFQRLNPLRLKEQIEQQLKLLFDTTQSPVRPIVSQRPENSFPLG
jgi:hypothetical protein